MLKLVHDEFAQSHIGFLNIGIKERCLQACQKESQRILPVVFGTGRLTQVQLGYSFKI